MINMGNDERMLKCIEELAELQRVMSMKLRFDERYDVNDLIKELADALFTIGMVINACGIGLEVGSKIREIREELGGPHFSIVMATLYNGYTKEEREFVT